MKNPAGGDDGAVQQFFGVVRTADKLTEALTGAPSPEFRACPTLAAAYQLPFVVVFF